MSDEELPAVNGGLNVLQIIQYTVKYGDNLMRIAVTYHSTTEAICAMNVISDSGSVAAGTELLIPVLWP